jgi:hypothetical protein
MREIVVTDDLRSYAYPAYYQVSSLFDSEARKWVRRSALLWAMIRAMV